MAALTAARSTPQMADKAAIDVVGQPVKATTVVQQGSIAVLDAGYVAPGRTAVGLIALGMATARYDNSAGAAGAITATVRKGVFKFANSAAGDLIQQANVGVDCYIVDDQTVALTNGGNTRSRAGRIIQVDADGVWVELGTIDFRSGVAIANLAAAPTQADFNNLLNVLRSQGLIS